MPGPNLQTGFVGRVFAAHASAEAASGLHGNRAKTDKLARPRAQWCELPREGFQGTRVNSTIDHDSMTPDTLGKWH